MVALAIWKAPEANWDLPLFAILLGFSIFSDLTAVDTQSRMRISGSFLALILAMVFLGGTPAALIGVISILIGWVRGREDGHYLLNNTLTYATFPLLTGVAFHGIVDRRADQRRPSPGSTASSSGSSWSRWRSTSLMIASYACYLERSRFFDKVREALVPLLPSELAAALMAVGVAFIYNQIGIAGVALFGIVLVTFQYLLGRPAALPGRAPRSWRCEASSSPASRWG